MNGHRKFALVTCSFSDSDWGENAEINLSLVSKVKSRDLEAWPSSALTQPRILTRKRTTDRTLSSGKFVYFSGSGN